MWPCVYSIKVVPGLGHASIVVVYRGMLWWLKCLACRWLGLVGGTVFIGGVLVGRSGIVGMMLGFIERGL